MGEPTQAGTGDGHRENRRQALRHAGQQPGRDQEKVEIKLSGLVAKTSAFSGKIGAALALTNAMPAHLQAVSGGTTITKQMNC